MAGATPAACFAHANDRSDTAGIIAQLGRPASGNGVDLVLGSGRSAIYKAAASAGLDLDAMLRGAGYALLGSPDAVRPDDRPRRRAYGRVRLRPVGDCRERDRRTLPKPARATSSWSNGTCTPTM